MGSCFGSIRSETALGTMSLQPLSVASEVEFVASDVELVSSLVEFVAMTECAVRKHIAKRGGNFMPFVSLTGKNPKN